MKIVIPTEITAGENRVAATPETVKKLIQLGYQVSIQVDTVLKVRKPLPDSHLNKYETGIKNPLFENEKAVMLYADAKEAVEKINKELRSM